MNKQLIRDSFGWGIGLWLFGYIVGIILFFVLPPSLVGWVTMPFGILVTLWVLLKKINNKSFSYFVLLGIIWMAIAIVFDYFFLVRIFKPEDGYYKLDVYLYYILTLMIPLLVGWWRQRRANLIT